MPGGARVVTLITLVRTLNAAMVEELVTRLHADGYDDISAAHHAVFENIDPAGTRLTTLARRAGVTRQSITELVIALERAGYLELGPDRSDGRARLARLTRKGRALAQTAVKHIEAVEAGWQTNLEQAGLTAQLRPLLEAAIAQHRSADPERLRPATRGGP